MSFYISKRAKDSSKGKILYHIGKQAPIPRPISLSRNTLLNNEYITKKPLDMSPVESIESLLGVVPKTQPVFEYKQTPDNLEEKDTKYDKVDFLLNYVGRTEEGWERPWLKEPVQSGVFLTDEPHNVFKEHGITEGKIYSVFVPFWVIAEAGGIHRYSGAREIIIPERLWEHCKILSSKDIPKEFNYFSFPPSMNYSDFVEVVPEINEEEIIEDLKRSNKEKKLKKKKSIGDNKMKLSKRAMLYKKAIEIKDASGNILYSDPNMKSLVNIDLSGKDFFLADFIKMDLSGANLSYSTLTSANFAYANLSNANLYGANFESAILFETNLSGAELRNANFYDADLRGADLRGASIYMATFKKARYDQNTKFTPGFGLPTKSMILISSQEDSEEDEYAPKGYVNPFEKQWGEGEGKSFEDILKEKDKLSPEKRKEMDFFKPKTPKCPICGEDSPGYVCPIHGNIPMFADDKNRCAKMKFNLSKRAALYKKAEDFEVDADSKCPWCGADKVYGGLGDDYCSNENCQWTSDWERAHEHDQDDELTHEEELEQLKRDDEEIERAQERDFRQSEREPDWDANDKKAILKFKLSKRG